MKDTQTHNADLISRSATKDIAAKYGATDDFNLLIDQIPTIDAVEVVRCRDCKYSFGLVNTGILYCEVNSGFTFSTPCNGFCSRGEKMNSEVSNDA